jgi:hypothetical protein
MRVFRVVPATAAVVAALAVPRVAAAAPTVSVAPTDQLGPEGASAVLFITASCDVGDQAQLFVTLSQASGKRLVQGTGSEFGADVNGQFVCDGTPQLIPLPVGVTTAPLKQGKAAVTRSSPSSVRMPR